MSGAVMNKFWDFIGLGKESDEEQEDIKYYGMYEGQEEEEYEEEDVNTKKLFGRKSKVVSMSQSQQIRMHIAKPTTFEQSEQICACLKDKKSIIVNLEYVNKDAARRIVDFLSGAVQALDGHIEKVSNSIFLVAPYTYEISNESTREEIKSKLSVSWLKNG